MTRLNPRLCSAFVAAAFGLVMFVDLLFLMCLLIYPLAGLGLVLMFLATFLVSNLGWGIFIYRAGRRRAVVGLEQTVSWTSGAVLLLLSVTQYVPKEGPGILLLILATLWIYRLAGGVFAGCVVAWAAFVFGRARERWAVAVSLSTAVVAWVLYLAYQSGGRLTEDWAETFKMLVSYAGVSSGVCLFLGECLGAGGGEVERETRSTQAGLLQGEVTAPGPQRFATDGESQTVASSDLLSGEERLEDSLG